MNWGLCKRDLRHEGVNVYYHENCKNCQSWFILILNLVDLAQSLHKVNADSYVSQIRSSLMFNALENKETVLLLLWFFITFLSSSFCAKFGNFSTSCIDLNLTLIIARSSGFLVFNILETVKLGKSLFWVLASFVSSSP